MIPAANSSLPESEDCLFLDVVVPTAVFHGSHRRKVPVLVNIHGGGFFIGDKTTLYDPQGLLAASKNEIIFVSMNYRVFDFFESFLTRIVGLKLYSSQPLASWEVLEVINPIKLLQMRVCWISALL